MSDGFPLGAALRDRIERGVSDAGYLQQPNVGRLEILSADELARSTETGATLDTASGPVSGAE